MYFFFARCHSSAVYFNLLEGKMLRKLFGGCNYSTSPLNDLSSTLLVQILIQYTSRLLFMNDLDHYLLHDYSWMNSARSYQLMYYEWAGIVHASTILESSEGHQPGPWQYCFTMTFMQENRESVGKDIKCWDFNGGRGAVHCVTKTMTDRFWQYWET